MNSQFLAPVSERFMRIENDVKLDFSDVLIRPKRSTLTSRKNVELERSFTFIHSGRDWTGVPIVAANMDTTGTFEVYKALKEYHMITALHKFLGLALAQSNGVLILVSQKLSIHDTLILSFPHNSGLQIIPLSG